MNKEQKNKIVFKVAEKYKKEILPILAQFEQERLKKRRLVKNINTANIAIIVVFIILGIFVFKSLDISFLIGINVLIMLICKMIKKSFENKIKEKIMPSLCSCFDDLKWSTYGEYLPDERLIVLSELFKTNSTSTFSYDDIFQGSWANVPFEIIELESRTHKASVSSSRRTSSKIQFRGVIVKFKIDKKFKSKTVILKNKQNCPWLDKNLKKSQFEDVIFEDKFDVYTQDEVEARYLITTSFMERLNNLKTAFDINEISCSFLNGTLLIALSTQKDLFHLASLDVPLTDSREFSKLYGELISIYDLIEYFKLDQKIKL